MPPRSWQLRIEDILTAIERIDSYSHAIDFDSFAGDQKTIDAVVRNLEIVGEASRHVPDEIQRRYASLPWTEMRSMRNLLSHGYFLVDVEIVWKTIREDLSPIVPELRRILDDRD